MTWKEEAKGHPGSFLASWSWLGARRKLALWMKRHRGREEEEEEYLLGGDRETSWV